MSSVMRYDRELGHRYLPNLRVRAADEAGGYLVQTNEDGFRAHRDFVRQRTPGTKRVLVFGDSQSAGDGVSNKKRWTDLIDADSRDIEIDNYCVSGTGTDQQYLTWKANHDRDHDVVIATVYVENIRRISSRVLRSKLGDGGEVFTPKPYFTHESGQLNLHHVPVPKDQWQASEVPPELASFVYPPQLPSVAERMRSPSTGPSGRLQRGAKSMAMRWERFRPMREYEDAEDPSWTLLRTILASWIRESNVPVLVVPLPHYFFVARPEFALSYQARFREFADQSGGQVFDPLPELLQLPMSKQRGLWSDSIGHLSADGHAAIADILERPLRALLDGAGT